MWALSQQHTQSSGISQDRPTKLVSQLPGHEGSKKYLTQLPQLLTTESNFSTFSVLTLLFPVK